MNELIILGVMLSIWTTFFVLYSVIGVAYYKLVLHSKKKILDIISEL